MSHVKIPATKRTLRLAASLDDDGKKKASLRQPISSQQRRGGAVVPHPPKHAPIETVDDVARHRKATDKMLLAVDRQHALLSHDVLFFSSYYDADNTTVSRTDSSARKQIPHTARSTGTFRKHRPAEPATARSSASQQVVPLPPLPASRRSEQGGGAKRWRLKHVSPIPAVTELDVWLAQYQTNLKEAARAEEIAATAKAKAATRRESRWNQPDGTGRKGMLSSEEGQWPRTPSQGKESLARTGSLRFPNKGAVDTPGLGRISWWESFPDPTSAAEKGPTKALTNPEKVEEECTGDEEEEETPAMTSNPPGTFVLSDTVKAKCRLLLVEGPEVVSSWWDDWEYLALSTLEDNPELSAIDFAADKQLLRYLTIAMTNLDAAVAGGAELEALRDMMDAVHALPGLSIDGDVTDYYTQVLDIPLVKERPLGSSGRSAGGEVVDEVIKASAHHTLLPFDAHENLIFHLPLPTHCGTEAHSPSSARLLNQSVHNGAMSTSNAAAMETPRGESKEKIKANKVAYIHSMKRKALHDWYNPHVAELEAELKDDSGYTSHMAATGVSSPPTA